MDTIDKLKILSSDSRYDLACACGTREDEHRKRGADGKWLYPVVLPQGGSTVLFKTLLSNACANDCKYCPLRGETNVRRCTLQPEEVAKTFMAYYHRRQAFGLFLSSAVVGSPDHTMDRINAAARILRQKYRFRGYIHLKIIPGASDAAIEETFSLASAVSLNIETPGKSHCELLSAKKDYERDIVRPLKLMSSLSSRGSRFAKVKCTTQFIVGAADEKDSEIVGSMVGLYEGLAFKRVYFSAYQKGLGDPSIPGERWFVGDPRDSFVREHRLYQVDFLLRKYRFDASDIFFDGTGNLSLEKDPKEVWAERHPDFYPIRINSAEKDELLRVPGLGPVSVERLIQHRGKGRISSWEVLGLKGKRLDTVKRYTVID